MIDCPLELALDDDHVVDCAVLARHVSGCMSLLKQLHESVEDVLKRSQMYESFPLDRDPLPEV